MKRISIMVATLTLASLVSAHSQTPQSVEVTAQTLASQPAGTTYVIDLTRTGKTYYVAADVVSRVRVRTATGEVAVGDLVREMELTGSKFLLGTASDLSAINYGLPPGGGTVQDPGTGTTEAKTNKNGTMAACVGKSSGRDCKDMQKAFCDGRGFACGKLGAGWGKGYAGQQGCACTTKKYGT